jgi:hypothetical protein
MAIANRVNVDFLGSQLGQAVRLGLVIDFPEHAEERHAVFAGVPAQLPDWKRHARVCQAREVLINSWRPARGRFGRSASKANRRHRRHYGDNLRL